MGHPLVDIEYSADLLRWRMAIRKSTFSVTISSEDIGKTFVIELQIKSEREHHAHSDENAWVDFHYTVLPKTNEPWGIPGRPPSTSVAMADPMSGGGGTVCEQLNR